MIKVNIFNLRRDSAFRVSDSLDSPIWYKGNFLPANRCFYVYSLDGLPPRYYSGFTKVFIES